MKQSSRRSLGLKPSALRMVRPTRRKAPRLGQHFLAHPQIAERMVRAALVGKGDTVLEIGPGKGILTAALLHAGARVVTVEADRALLPALEERFAGALAKGRLVLVAADIRDYMKGAMREVGEPYAVVANIPYYITGEIIRGFLEAKAQPSSVALLVQKEVALRIARSTKESLLSLSVKAYGEPKAAFTVPKGAFRPAPSVDSAVLTIRRVSRDHFEDAGHETRFFALIHAGFAHKRKRLSKNLAEAGFTDEAARVGRVRAEDVPLPEWLILSKSKNSH